jgi:sulfur-oxidizing protein SoxY
MTVPTRRQILISAAALIGGTGMASLLAIKSTGATPAMMRAAIRKVVGEAPLRKGKVRLDLPPLIENGNTVPMTVSVDSPMTEADHVKAIHVFNEKNPQPNVLSVRLGARAGKAAISSRIRLADSQTVTAIAEMSDGFVTLAACVEGI